MFSHRRYVSNCTAPRKCVVTYVICLDTTFLTQSCNCTRSLYITVKQEVKCRIHVNSIFLIYIVKNKIIITIVAQFA